MLDNLPTSRFVVNTRKEVVTAPSFDRKEEILEIATELLQARSFSSFSYADLSARLGISKASIHHHFPTKEAMARALVERFRASNRQLLVDLDRQHKDPWQRLEILRRDPVPRSFTSNADIATRSTASTTKCARSSAGSQSRRSGGNRYSRDWSRWTNFGICFDLSRQRQFSCRQFQLSPANLSLRQDQL